MSQKRRWLPDELALASDLAIEAEDVALELGRSVVSVVALRKRMARGWEPRKPFVPLTADQIEFIAAHPEKTAQSVADELQVKYALVTKARRSLATERGLSFGTGPYDKDPNTVGGRRLLGKTCSKCGVLRGGADFHRDGRKLAAVCRFCRAETRGPDGKEAREEMVRTLAPQMGVEYRAHHAEEYTQRDLDVLADPALTIVEKAARLGRTYGATSMAVQVFGFSSKIEQRNDLRGVWIIDGQTRTAAEQDPDRSGFGKRPRKSHCKWGHELTPENLYHSKSRAPDCLTCRNVRNRTKVRA